jgi:hypothetical protein
MESSNVKTYAYVIIVLAVGLFLGIAFVKLNKASQGPTDVNPQAQAERLQALENSPGITSPAAKNFINSEQSRQQETKDVFDQTVHGQ